MNDVLFPDVAVVRAQARTLWEQQERRRIGIQERIGQSVPWWLILIAGVFFLLSAPHTSAMFDRLTPGYGWVAPVGVEFGLLYAAFRRKQARATGEAVPRTLWGLEALLFITAVIVNGAGSFIAVVEASGSGLIGLSIGRLLADFGTLPATNQVALFLVPLAALIIPVGTGVAGEGLAALLLERRATGDVIERRWRLVAAEIEFTALRDAALNEGIPARRAIEWAGRITGYMVADVSVRPQLSAADNGGQPDADGQADRLLSAGQQRTGSGYARASDARERVKAYLAAHPEAMGRPVREVAEAVGVGKTVTGDVMKEMRP